MGTAIVTIKVMPSSPDEDLEAIKKGVLEAIDSFTGLDAEKKVELQPIAFGLKALIVTFVMKEETGSTEPLEKSIESIRGVQSVQVVDVRRAIG